jgi:hypothetical protein
MDYICPRCNNPGERAKQRNYCARCHKNQCNDRNKTRRNKHYGVTLTTVIDGNEIREEKLCVPYATLASNIPWSIALASDYSRKAIRVSV